MGMVLICREVIFGFEGGRDVKFGYNSFDGVYVRVGVCWVGFRLGGVLGWG